MEDKWRGGAVGGATGAVSSVSTRWRPEQWSSGDTLTTGRTRHCTLHRHTALTALCTYRADTDLMRELKSLLLLSVPP